MLATEHLEVHLDVYCRKDYPPIKIPYSYKFSWFKDFVKSLKISFKKISQSLKIFVIQHCPAHSVASAPPHDLQLPPVFLFGTKFAQKILPSEF